MNRYAQTIFALFLSSYAVAEQDSLDPCDQVAFRADLTYTLRDQNTLKEALESPFKGYHQADKKKVLWEVVIEAFEAPNFEGWEYRMNTATDLANKWALDCYKNPEKYKFMLEPITIEE